MAHKLGQVFLKDRNIIGKIIQAAALSSEDHVLEVGSGEGWLSLNLAKGAGHLTVVELDKKWAKQTQERLAEFPNTTVIQGDILDQSPLNFSSQPIKIVTNLPYYISAKFVQWIIQYRAHIHTAVVMIQKEFAQKLVATAGQELYSSLGIFSQFYLESTILFGVSKNCFRPIPRVDSAVIQLTPRAMPLYPDVDEAVFFSLVQSAFWGRRKPLLSCLKKSPHFQAPVNLETCSFFQQHPKIRGENMAISQFYDLYCSINAL